MMWVALILTMVALAAAARAIAARTQARRETAIVVAQLELRICELEQQSRDISLLLEMAQLLHLGGGIVDPLEIATSFARRLFPIHDGAIYVVQPGCEHASLLAWWGARPDVTSIAGDSFANGRVCYPMFALGDWIGVLALRTDTAALEPVAKAFADQLGAALATLRMQETLKARAVRDPLTGLFNRRHLEEALHLELQRCRLRGTPVSVILIDVDHFKRFNDRFGHGGGDALLQHFARAVQRSVREQDVVCRYGGEEFAILLPNTPLDVAIDCAERLRLELHTLEVRHGGQLLGSVTMSAGVASAPEHGFDPDKLLDAADQALYRAKNNGRDCVLGRNAA